MASLWRQKRSSYWYIRFVDPNTGKRVRRSTGTTDRKTAELFLKEIEIKIAKGQYGFDDLNPDTNMRAFSKEYIETYSKVNKSSSTCRIDSLSLKHWIGFVGNISLNKVTIKMIEQYKRERLKSIKPVSLNFELRSLKAAFQVAVKWDYLETNPFKGVKLMRVEESEAPRFLSGTEINQLLEVVEDEKLRSLFEFYLNTGGRRNEVLCLTWSNIDIKNKIVTFVNGTKFGKKRTVPLNPRAYEILMQLRKSGDKPSSRPFNFEKNYITRKFKVYARKAGLPESIRTHSLRHTFASILVMNGVDMQTIKELLGHSSLKVTEMYAHLSPQHKITAVEKLIY